MRIPNGLLTQLTVLALEAIATLTHTLATISIAVAIGHLTFGGPHTALAALPAILTTTTALQVPPAPVAQYRTHVVGTIGADEARKTLAPPQMTVAIVVAIVDTIGGEVAEGGDVDKHGHRAVVVVDDGEVPRTVLE